MGSPAGRLRALAEYYGLPDGASDQLETLLALVLEDPRAATSVRDPALAVDAHVADSLAGLTFDRLRLARAVADLGSGAGFPGLPLAVAAPAAHVRLIESVGRKAAFLTDASQAMALGDRVEVVARRAEDWPAGLAAHDAVVVRALAPLPVVLEYAAPLLELGGCAVLWRGARRPSEEGAAGRAARILGLELVEVRRVRPFEGALHRYLHLYSKVGVTPARFPRRAGVARRRPLGT